jgi:hypothetical protein
MPTGKKLKDSCFVEDDAFVGKYIFQTLFLSFIIVLDAVRGIAPKRTNSVGRKSDGKFLFTLSSL